MTMCDSEFLLLNGHFQTDNKGSFRRIRALGPVLLRRYDAVAIFSANGSAAFKESYSPIG